MSVDTACYAVYAYTLLDGIEFTDLVAFLYGYECACRLARYSFRIGAYKAEVFECEDNGDLSLVWSGLAEEFNRTEVDAFRQLREAGSFNPVDDEESAVQSWEDSIAQGLQWPMDELPDPEDSPFFATSFAPFEKV